jgi:hypothetical protein
LALKRYILTTEIAKELEEEENTMTVILMRLMGEMITAC